jgi:hypothetical protein
MTCRQLRDNVCAIASEIAGQPAAANELACRYCTEQAEPRQAVNQVTVSLALKVHPPKSSEWTAIYEQHGQHLRRDTRSETHRQQLAAIMAGTGPGSQLWRLLERLGVQHSPDCGCLSRAKQMNAWGVAGCRAARAEIVGWMEAGKDRYGWATIAKAAGLAVVTGLAFRLSVTDPFGSLVDEAIRLAEVASFHRDPTGSV